MTYRIVVEASSTRVPWRRYHFEAWVVGKASMEPLASGYAWTAEAADEKARDACDQHARRASDSPSPRYYDPTSVKESS